MQEMECLNNLNMEIIRSLQELMLGFKGELTMTDQMDNLMEFLVLQRIPPKWVKAFPTTRALASWVTHVKERIAQLNEFKDDPNTMLKVTYINRLFGPQSFLNAVKQVNAQISKNPLNQLWLDTEITKK
jgi:dynein heavy chain